MDGQKLVSKMDGAVGFIRVGYDFSLWPVAGRNQNSAGSSNIFSSANSCAGSTVVPWIESMTSQDVVVEVVDHVLGSVAKTHDDNPTLKPESIKLKKEWPKVLRLGLVVNSVKGSTVVNHSPRKSFNTVHVSGTPTSPQPSSLVILKPDVALMHQTNVIQSISTTGTIRTLETAIVVVPYDNEEHQKKEEEKKEQQETQRRALVVKASSEDMQRKFQTVRNRDDQIRKHADKMRNAFNAKVLEQDVPELKDLIEKQKQVQEKKEKIVSRVELMETQWKHDLVLVEQTLSRLDGRVSLYQGEKNEIEQMLHDLHHQHSSSNDNGSMERSYY